MDMKWHAYLLGARKRLPVVLEIICQILSSHGMKNRFESYFRSQLSDPSDLPCYDLFQFLGKLIHEYFVSTIYDDQFHAQNLYLISISSTIASAE